MTGAAMKCSKPVKSGFLGDRRVAVSIMSQRMSSSAEALLVRSTWSNWNICVSASDEACRWALATALVGLMLLLSAQVVAREELVAAAEEGLQEFASRTFAARGPPLEVALLVERQGVADGHEATAVQSSVGNETRVMACSSMLSQHPGLLLRVADELGRRPDLVDFHERDGAALHDVPRSDVARQLLAELGVRRVGGEPHPKASASRHLPRHEGTVLGHLTHLTEVPVQDRVLEGVEPVSDPDRVGGATCAGNQSVVLQLQALDVVIRSANNPDAGGRRGRGEDPRVPEDDPILVLEEVNGHDALRHVWHPRHTLARG